jgi:glycosyltransferase involved in cell wall biosynthesis
VTQATATPQSVPRLEPSKVSLGAGPASAQRVARVLIVESNEDGTVGGSHQALFDLVVRFEQTSFEPVVLFYEENAFASRLRDRGIEVVLFDELTEKRRGMIPIRGPVSKAIRFGMDILHCRRELQRLQIDLLHMNNSPSVGNDNWLPAARLLGIPCIVTAMGNPDRPRRLIHRWLYRRFDLYLAISRHVADGLRAQGVDPRRIKLNYAGVDFDTLRERVSRPREVVRRDLGVHADQVLVLMVGNIREWKGQREVLAAVCMLPRYILDRMRFFFVGAAGVVDAQYEAELRKEVARSGLAGCVTFLGARSDVPDLFRAADIAIHASITPEPFGLVVPEAMALGCAVIAASSGGPAEVIVPGTGLLCDPAQPEQYARALEQMIRDDAGRRAIAAAGPARAAIFGIEPNVAGTLSAYRALLAKGRRRRRKFGLSGKRNGVSDAGAPTGRS